MNFPKNQIIWINPQRCIRMANIGARRQSGIVRRDDWDLHLPPITDSLKIRCCLQHWNDGLSWEETGLFDHIMQEIERDGSYDGCSTREEMLERYRLIDAMFEQVKTDGYVRTACDLGRSDAASREPRGVVFHIDRNGDPVFAGSGHHRFAAALAVGLQIMPATLGAVHEGAVEMTKEKIRSSEQGYQSQRAPKRKAEMIQGAIDFASVGSVLDVGCNEGFLTELMGEGQRFAVGVDIAPHFIKRLEQKQSASYGIMPMSQAVAENLPDFDMITLLSVHHQWHKTMGDEKTERLVRTLGLKARRYFVIEFAARNSKYGFAPDRFSDNKEASIRSYATKWLDGLNIPGTIQYIGKNPEVPAEPFRHTFVIDRTKRVWPGERLARKAARKLKRLLRWPA